MDLTEMRGVRGRTHTTRRPGLLLVGALLVLSLCAYGSYYLWLVMTDSLGIFHHTTAVADLDGDGDLDVLLHNLRKESEFTPFSGATLWMNQSDGQFVPRALDESGLAAAAGDVDGDGYADLLIFNGHVLQLMANRGPAKAGQPGEFQGRMAVSAMARQSQYGSILLGDLDDNGRLDAVVAGCCGRLFAIDPGVDTPNFSWVWRNQSEAGRSAGQMLTALDGLAVQAAALGDVDGDGAPDLFAAVIAPPQGRNRDAADRVLLNDGAGGFADSGQQLGDNDSTAVALGDVDGDGDLDALVGNGSGAEVWFNRGGAQAGQEGAFDPSGRTLRGRPVMALFLANLDGDGDPDAVVGERSGARIWWNDGQGTFTRSRQRFGASPKHGWAVGDFDGDGRPDLFAASYARDYRLWLNQGEGTFRAGP